MHVLQSSGLQSELCSTILSSLKPCTLRAVFYTQTQLSSEESVCVRLRWCALHALHTVFYTKTQLRGKCLCQCVLVCTRGKCLCPFALEESVCASVLWCALHENSQRMPAARKPHIAGLEGGVQVYLPTVTLGKLCTPKTLTSSFKF